MEKLMQRKERYPLATQKNRVVISLLIYQALHLDEITRIRLRDIELGKGNIYVLDTIRIHSMTLTLRLTQVMLFTSKPTDSGWRC